MWATSRRSTELELIDAPIESREELADSFRDIALINRFFGGTAVARYALHKLEARSVLDVACGIADIPFSLRLQARRAGKDVQFTCLDANEELLEIARERSDGDPGMTFVHCDARALPFADASFDAAMCNLSLHHFAPDAAVVILRELRRVARVMPVATDLRRGTLPWLAACTFGHVFTNNRLTRNDAPLSALRAYTPQEALSLAERAGWRSPRVERYKFIRMVLFDASTI